MFERLLELLLHAKSGAIAAVLVLGTTGALVTATVQSGVTTITITEASPSPTLVALTSSTKSPKPSSNTLSSLTSSTLTECKARLPLKSIVAPREPQVRATVVTVQTTLLPQNQTFIHVLAIANGRARSSDEVDSWRLFDLNRDSVTFVDDIAKTYRTESFRSLLAKRREAVIAPLPEGIPAAKLRVTGAKRAILGAQASEVLLRLGGYQRDLWVANHPALPPRLYTLMYLSQPATSPFAPIMKEFDDAQLPSAVNPRRASQ